MRVGFANQSSLIYYGRWLVKNNIDGLFTIGDFSMNATKSFGKGAFHFSNYDELGESLTRILNKDTNILVKGSRAMKMEKIVEMLTEKN